MSCPVCQRREVAGSCNDGFVAYLSDDYPCVFNKQAAGPRNLRVLPPLPHYNPCVIEHSAPDNAQAMSAEGLEDLL